MKLPAPNPVWMREMKQAARLTRTPFILAGVTAFAALAVSAVGGAAATSTAPAEVGVILFQTFFSLAFAVVSWVGPGVAALTVVSERTGRTWEALVLTGLSPRRVATGKFLASLTYIGLYLVALAPVGALPFLFGGVTATEVVTAFVVLCVLAVIAVGFGLAVSSGASTPGGALLVTLPFAVGGSLFTYSALGVGMSVAAHELWPAVSQGLPVWLPTAYVRADFGAEYVLYLLLLPAGVTAVLASLFYEVTASNLADASDDRSSGLKRWFLLALAVTTLLGVGAPLTLTKERWVLTLVAQGVSSLVSLYALFALSTEPAGPSRRVLARWEREHASALRRFLGPGMAKTALLLVLGTMASQVVLCAVGAATELAAGGTVAHCKALALFGAYAVAFFGFLAGFATYARALGESRLRPRALLAVALFGAAAGPLFALAIAGAANGFSSWSWVLAPSPLYVVGMVAALDGGTMSVSFAAGLLSMGGWAVLGLVLGLVGWQRLGRAVAVEIDGWARLAARISAEDAGRAGARPEPSS